MTLLYAIAASVSLAFMPAQDPPEWEVLDRVSQVDGARSYLAGRPSETPVLNNAGRHGLAQFAVACVDGDLSVSITWPAYLGRDSVSITASVDGEQAQSWEWSVARGGSVAVAHGAREWRRFKASAGEAERLAVRVHAYAGAQETTFDLRGISGHMVEAEAACARPSRRR